MREQETTQVLLHSPLYRAADEREGAGEKEANGHGDEVNPLQWKQDKPQFTVKAKGLAGYVGSAWMRQGKFGNFIRVYLREDLPKGTVLFVSPTKANDGLLDR
jgi:hypothetical protein